MMECSRITGSHCDDDLTPSSDISSCNTPTAITGSYTDTVTDKKQVKLNST